MARNKQAQIDLRSRRQFLQSVGQTSAMLTVASASPILFANDITLACSDPEAASGEGLRRSMNYQPIVNSKQTTKNCRSCSYYSADNSSCGYCQIFSGIVNVDGSCDVWSA